MSMEVLSVAEFQALYGDPAKAAKRKRSRPRMPRVKGVPNACELKVRDWMILPMVMEGVVTNYIHGDEYGKIQLATGVSYKPDWVLHLATGAWAFVECKQRWENASRKEASAWRLRETMVKLRWLAAIKHPKGDQVWLVTLTKNEGFTQEQITP